MLVPGFATMCCSDRSSVYWKVVDMDVDGMVVVVMTEK